MGVFDERLLGWSAGCMMFPWVNSINEIFLTFFFELESNSLSLGWRGLYGIFSSIFFERDSERVGERER